MVLTAENYYSQEANEEYMSVSQFKDFCGTYGKMPCEFTAMEKLKGRWEEPKSKALMVGSYVDSYFEGTLDKFKAENPDLFKRDGTLKAEFVKADEIIQRIERDDYFMKFMSGKKQVIMTGELFGTKWKIKMDSYIPDIAIVDLKVMASITKLEWVRDIGYLDFVRYWGYDIQGAIYQEIVRQNTGKKLPFYIAGATKESEPDIRIMDDSYIGNESDYKRWAESVAGIGTAIVVPEWNGPETVKIIVLDGNGEAANETLQKAVYNYIMSPESPLDRLAPPNTILTVSAPELVEIDYTIKSIELEDGYAQEEVLKDFKTGLAKYYKTVNSEGEVKYNWVHSVLTNTPGVDDFEELLMNGGISNIKIKLDQYPNTKSVMVKEGS